VKICRFKFTGETRVGLVIDNASVADLTSAGITQITPLLEDPNAVSRLVGLKESGLVRHSLAEVELLPPVERQEVWAAGVTYLRSKVARMDESDFSATAYDKVYSADRPEIFFKSIAEKVVGPGDKVGIRKDATWNVPEPELALVLNSKSQIVGYTVGNDMSSRDIEGENLLYLAQAKVYDRSCALGPWIVLGTPEAAAREWVIRIKINRGGTTVFAGKTSVNQIKRAFTELAAYLFRSQSFAHGAVLLTGTGVVPDEHFTLQPADRVSIEISGIGLLENEVTLV
jgi:2-dehydro-3-deoxy-D-arabinonate dehydratase